MKRTMCFFPFVGVIIGAAEFALYMLLRHMEAGASFSSALLLALPLLLTGGIHMDGYMDTNDAVRSWRGREEKLRILKDPHVGAFAVIYGILYAVLAFGGISEFTRLLKDSAAWRTALSAAFIFPASRSVSGLSALIFPKARKDGMLRSVADASEKSSAAILGAEAAVLSVLMAVLSPAAGIAAVCANLAVWGYYHHMSLKLFGGTTGDLAGWFVCVSELAMLYAMTAAVYLGW